jgi:hypothetical protein
VPDDDDDDNDDVDDDDYRDSICGSAADALADRMIALVEN